MVSVAASLAVPVVVLAVTVALAVTSWERGDLNRFICDGGCGPSNVIAPEGLAVGAEPPAAAPDRAVDGDGTLDPAKIEAAVAAGLGDEVLGPRVGFMAMSADGTSFSSRADRAYAPASTTKVLTGLAALETIDPETRFTTSVVRSADGVILVGGGDPFLSTKPARTVDDRVLQADLTTLARRTAEALKSAGTRSVTLAYDASLFVGPDASPTWEPDYVTANIVTPVSALWVDQGVTDGIRDREPAVDAARTFAQLMAAEGIAVTGDPPQVDAPAGAPVVSEVRSATLAQIVETLVRVSDNEAAEIVLRHVAIAGGRTADFDGGTAAVRAALDTAGVSTQGLVLNDGSGLSRDNRITPTTLVEALRMAHSSPRTSGLLADLPVSGFTGTLVDRFAQLTGARGTVRAKTGTLTGIHSLAGYLTDAEGQPVFFAVMADRTDRDMPVQAQAALDRVAAALADCSCG